MTKPLDKYIGNVDVIPVEALDGVFIRKWNAAFRDLWEIMCMQVTQGERHFVRAWMARWSVCDSEGNLYYTDEDIDELSQMDAEVGTILVNATKAHNELEEEELEDAEKNSSETLSESSGIE